MKKIMILELYLALLSITAFGQNKELNISFLETQPIIDGLPDKETNSLEWNQFSHIEKTNQQNQDYAVRYKIGYQYSFLYLFIESSGDSIIYRDRAYQNGDGFHLVIAEPDSAKPADEFYVLRFSPANKSGNQKAKKGVWYYNIDLSGRSLSAATQFECNTINGKNCFELLLPWNEVYPYHPLFSDEIGINLCFVKAVGKKEKNYYFMKYDEKIQCEQSERKYMIADFEKPACIENPCTYARLDKKNQISGKALKIKFVSNVCSTRQVTYLATVRSADNYIYSDLYKEVYLVPGLNENEFDLAVENLAPGAYKVVWKCSDNSEGEIPLTLLPEISGEKERHSLLELKSQISESDYYTMLFRLESVLNEYSRVKEYETAGHIRELYSKYQIDKAQLINNPGLLSDRTGISRRAFQSKVDGTLQPYSIKVPVNFDRNKKYPLFIMLHGSGSDDQGMLKENLTDGNFIEIAPFGRGTSNCFTTDYAEKDVKEAIDDAILNYPVDTSKIIIAGFSMGGYGAYRIFYEYPGLFKGVVVFSGHPNLAGKWIGEGYPDFLNPTYLKPFKNIPVFIYHSKNDLNCPYDLTHEVVEKLKKAGAGVEFITTEEGGHEILNDRYRSVYLQWLKNVIEK
jgi:predicted esterase